MSPKSTTKCLGYKRQTLALKAVLRVFFFGTKNMALLPNTY